MASVRDCRALADAQPVEVTNAKMPWFISSQAGGGGEGKRKKGDDERKCGERRMIESSYNYNKHLVQW